MSELKHITMIFNGKPSEESFEKFVKIITEAPINIKITEIKNNKNDLREAPIQAKQDND